MSETNFGLGLSKAYIHKEMDHIGTLRPMAFQSKSIYLFVCLFVNYFYFAHNISTPCPQT